ncbi:hypothetical protein BAE44_0011257 [Dichanthelium oligosanthes]|uniref:Uncharacterized protein n=1 Tax=Dichanthelium oligosanthes TaxID=888268 RepID=A0A1E5VRH7_9POAL|nr:hypothetical protein BAE44_0011257 [Dichanthelium oligosanthes]
MYMPPAAASLRWGRAISRCLASVQGNRQEMATNPCVTRLEINVIGDMMKVQSKLSVINFIRTQVSLLLEI